jgi:hypothetical protein
MAHVLVADSKRVRRRIVPKSVPKPLQDAQKTIKCHGEFLSDGHAHNIYEVFDLSVIW